MSNERKLRKAIEVGADIDVVSPRVIKVTREKRKKRLFGLFGSRDEVVTETIYTSSRESARIQRKLAREREEPAGRNIGQARRKKKRRVRKAATGGQAQQIERVGVQVGRVGRGTEKGTRRGREAVGRATITRKGKEETWNSGPIGPGDGSREVAAKDMTRFLRKRGVSRKKTKEFVQHEIGEHAASDVGLGEVSVTTRGRKIKRAEYRFLPGTRTSRDILRSLRAPGDDMSLVDRKLALAVTIADQIYRARHGLGPDDDVPAVIS